MALDYKRLRMNMKMDSRKQDRTSGKFREYGYRNDEAAMWLKEKRKELKSSKKKNID